MNKSSKFYGDHPEAQYWKSTSTYGDTPPYGNKRIDKYIGKIIIYKRRKGWKNEEILIWLQSMGFYTEGNDYMTETGFCWSLRKLGLWHKWVLAGKQVKKYGYSKPKTENEQKILRKYLFPDSWLNKPPVFIQEKITGELK